MAVSKEDLEALSKNFNGENINKIFSAGLLTFPKYLSSSRSIMSSGFQVQRTIPCKPDFPRIYTGFENAFGEYADSLTKTEANYRVIEVINKFTVHPQHVYLYIVQNILTGQYDVIEIKHYEKYSESHGYIKPQTNGDLKLPGSFIKSGEILAHAPSHDEYGNYCCGINAKVAYVSIPEVEEDGYAVSDEFAEKTKIYQMEEESILVNNNTILLNIYGNKNDYKCFPDIFEEVKNGVVCARRQINYTYAASELTTDTLSKILDGDKCIHGEGKIIDIDVFINNEEELINNTNRSQIMQYWIMTKLYHENIVKTLGAIIKEKGSIYSYKLKLMYERSKDFLNPEIKFTSSNGIFEFALINFTVCKETSLFKGYKLCDRHGSKGVVCHILPKDQMPRDVWGNVADIIQSPPSVIARANIAQCFEHELNFASDHIRRLMAGASSAGIRKQFAILYDYLEIIDKDQAIELKNKFDNQNEYSQAQYIADVIMNGIYIRQAPFNGTITIEQLEKIYTKYNIKPNRIRMKREFKYHGEKPLFKDNTDHEKYFAFLKNLKGQDISVNEITPLDLKERDNLDHDLSDDDVIFKNEFLILDEERNPYKIVLDKKNGYTRHEIADNRDLYQMALDNWTDETFIEYRNDSIIRSFLTENPVIIAEKYFMILKHVPDGKLSSRFIGSTNPLGLPNKTTKADIQGPISETPIKFGEMELFNAIMRLEPKIVYEYLSMVAKNPEIRSKLFHKCLYSDPLELFDLDIPEEEIFNDIPAKEFKAYLFCLGFEIIENPDDDIYSSFDEFDLTTNDMIKIVEKYKETQKVLT